MRAMGMLLGAAMLAAVPASAQTTVAESDPGASYANFTRYMGQSFTVPVGTSFNNVTIQFLNATGTALTTGNVSIYSAVYAGTAGNVGTDTTNLVGRSTSNVGGSYVFDPSVTLNAGTQYWAYISAPGQVGATANALNGGDYYFSDSAGSGYFFSGPNDGRILVQGQDAAPEPGTWAMMLSGFATAGIAVRRRRKAALA